MIDDTIRSEIANYCRSIRKPIKEKFKLFNPSEKNGKVCIIYQKISKKEINKKYMKKQTKHTHNEIRLNFYRTLITMLKNKQMSMNEMIKEMDQIPLDGVGTKKSIIANFLSGLKRAELINKPCRGVWAIDSQDSVDQILEKYQAAHEQYVEKMRKDRRTKKDKQIDNTNINNLQNLVNLFKDSKININVSGSIDVNVTVNVKLSVEK